MSQKCSCNEVAIEMPKIMRHWVFKGSSNLIVAFAGLAIGLLAWKVQDSEAASRATVKGDPAAVHSQMSRTSPVLKSLKRGDEVMIDVAITGSDGEWCSISKVGQTIISGYVRCEFLEQEPQLHSQKGPVRPGVTPAAAQTSGRESATGPGRGRDVAREVREFKKSVRGKTGGDTPLIQVTAVGDTAAVQALLAQGVKVNATNRAGETALMFAAENGHITTVQALLAARSTVDARNIFRETALILAAGNGHTEVVQALTAAGADVNARDDSTSPVLAIAAGEGHTTTVQALLAAGADVNASSNGGYTALINAAQSGYIDTVQALLAAGADVNFSYGGGGRNQPLTALLVAKANGHNEIVRLLREAGARE